MPDDKLKKLVENARTILVVNQIKNKKSSNANGGDEAVAGVPWTELAVLLGVDLNPADDPIEFAAALKAKVDEISSKLGGAPAPEVIPDEVVMAATEDEQQPVAMAGTQEVDKTLAANRRRVPARTQTLAEWMSTAPPQVQSAVTNAMALEKQAKTKLVQRLVGNIASAPQRQAMGAKLMLKTLGELQDLTSLIPEAQSQQIETPNFAFAGGAGGDTGMLGNTEADDSDNLLPVFAVNFDEMASPKLRQRKTA